ARNRRNMTNAYKSFWQTTPLTAPRQHLINTHPRSAAYAISRARDYHPNVWSNSSSRIGSASTPAMCTNRLCPASALRFAVWSNSSSGIASNTASRAASRCANSISSGGERAGAIAGALVARAQIAVTGVAGQSSAWHRLLPALPWALRALRRNQHPVAAECVVAAVWIL
ncbi:MAG: hypothetical protein RL635_196, partial [Chloroflexota bacterium]